MMVRAAAVRVHRAVHRRARSPGTASGRWPPNCRSRSPPVPRARRRRAAGQVAMTAELRHFIEGVLLVLAALLPIVNPLGGAPVFLALTANVDDATRSLLARKVAVNGVLPADGVGVRRRLRAGILRAVGAGRADRGRARRLQPRVGAAQGRRDARRREGGLRHRRRRHRDARVLSVDAAADGGTRLHLGRHHDRRQSSDHRALVSRGGGDVRSSASSSSASPCMRATGTRAAWAEFLGRTGTAVVLRLSAFILLCIGVQIVWNGADALLGISGAPRGRLP